MKPYSGPTWLLNFTNKYISSPYSTYLFSVLFFIEEFLIFPILSPILAIFWIENRKKSFIYAIAATLISGLTAIIGYYIGVLLCQYGARDLIGYFMAPEKFNQAIALYKQYHVWAVFAAILTPIPFKALTISAGFCGVSLISITLSIMLARSLRFFVIAGALYIWGEKAKYYFNKYFYFFLLLLLSFFAISWKLLH